jgi:hypothetical protein
MFAFHSIFQNIRRNLESPAPMDMVKAMVVDGQGASNWAKHKA